MVIYDYMRQQSYIAAATTTTNLDDEAVAWLRQPPAPVGWVLRQATDNTLRNSPLGFSSGKTGPGRVARGIS
jgi:hypothetical protein